MLLIDNSGSMVRVDDGGTRLDHVVAALEGFFDGYATAARLGMTAFPVAPECGAPSTVAVTLNDSNDDPESMAATADEIRAALNALIPRGGAPTALSVRMLKSYPALQNAERDDYILLLTDGFPNCNDENPVTCENPAACRCALGGVCGNPGGQYCTLGCIDVATTVAEIAAAREKQIRTIVVGFGADLTNPDGMAMLEDLAQAGGFARHCPGGTDAECGAGSTCERSMRLCSRNYYLASTAPELGAALLDIARTIAP